MHGIKEPFSLPHPGMKTLLCYKEVRNRLRDTAKDMGKEGKDDYYGYGLVNAFAALSTSVFDTDSPASPYPSMSGTHYGTITPNQTITVNKLYTYPCAGAGGHTESIELYENGGFDSKWQLDWLPAGRLA